jgi:rSAM-associated Gly-rich repeat protein
MSDFNRREFLHKLVQSAGTVVVASAAWSAAPAQASQDEPRKNPADDVKQRADRLVAAVEENAAEETEAVAEFLNGAFRNTPVGAFRNHPLGAFRNHPLGAFRNGPVGGFRNGPAGGFGNGGWPNGGWGGFNNGGWPNGAWRNWW